MRHDRTTRALRTRMLRMLTIAMLTLGALAPASAWAASPADAIEDMLDSWHVSRARPLVEAMATDRGETPQVTYFRSRMAFYEQRYDEALTLMDQALANSSSKPPGWVMLREEIAAAGEVTRDYVTKTSPKGYFEITYPKGKDEVLLPYAFDALDEAYEVFGRELGMRPATPVRVEIYPNSLVLAKVSSLTETDIKTTGTIALCKYNRLMVTSPNALLQGYGWVDTAVHEYVHYVINHKTSARVPIWMHEGLAKYLEKTWRGAGEHRLPPSSEKMLRDRLEADDLVTFEQMHPSMAKLPSAEDAATAYAEVYTVMEYLHRQKGEGVFALMLDKMSAGLDAKQAYSATLGVDFGDFERTIWPSYLRSRPKVDFAEAEGFDDGLKFKGDGAKSAPTELEQVAKPEAKQHVQLGLMLQTRGRPKAAAVQYEKAVRLMGDSNPVVQTRLAQSLLESGDAKGALDALAPARESYPTYVTTWLIMGKASAALGEHADARDHLLEAARINPFDPEVHALLAAAYDALGDKDTATREREYAALVR